jgi:hypothetical protein
MSPTCHENRHAKVGLLALAILAALSTADRTVHSQVVPKGKKHMTTNDSYPIQFASPKRDSAVPTSTSATGKVSWSCEIGKAANPTWPPTVLLWGEFELVTTYSDMVLVDRHGKRLWARPKQANSPVVIAGNTLYFKGPNHFLQAIDVTDRPVLKDAPFPSAMSEEVLVHLFWPREKDFVAVLYAPPEDSVADGDSPDTPMGGDETTVLRNRYKTTYGDWRNSQHGSPKLAPLLIPERNLLTVFLGSAMRFNVDQDEKLSEFTMPLKTPIEWSVDTSETYTVIGYDSGRKVLLALSGSGQELWRWTDSQEQDGWAQSQPPIHARGRTCVLTEGRVMAFEKGKLVWQFDARSEGLRHGAHESEGGFQIKDGRLLATGTLRHGTALSDGSLLVTSSKTLFHLNSEGRKVFSVSVDSDILNPPVVDSKGNIYLATATRLYQIQ